MLTFKIYSFLSILVMGGCIINSYSKHEQFYPILSDMVNSKICRVASLNFILMIVLAVVTSICSFTFGEISEGEKMIVLEKLKRKVFDLAIMFIFFRDDNLDIRFFAMFLSLIGISVMHWLVIRRSELILTEMSDQATKKHTKIIFFYLGMMIFDLTLMYAFFYKWQTFVSSGIMATLFFGEITLTLVKVLLPFVKYAINLLELITITHYENKTMIFTILDFVFTVIKLIIRLFIINYVRTNFGMPIHLIFDAVYDIIQLYQTFKNFKNAIKLVRQLNNLENATKEEIEKTDTMCLICQDDLEIGKKINCGHIFHQACLSTWVQKAINQVCPKCKQPINLDKLIIQNKQKQQIKKIQEQSQSYIKKLLEGQQGSSSSNQSQQNNITDQNSSKSNILENLLKQQQYQSNNTTDNNNISNFKISVTSLKIDKKDVQNIDQNTFIKKTINIQNVYQSVCDQLNIDINILQEILDPSFTSFIKKYKQLSNVGPQGFGLAVECNYNRTREQHEIQKKISVFNKLLVLVQENPLLLNLLNMT